MKIVILIFLCVLLVSASQSHTCSCVPPEHIEINDGYDQIIIAEAKKRAWTFSKSNYKYKFRIIKTLLGNEQERIIIYTSKYGSACGRDFEVGVEYLIIVRKSDYKFESDACSSWIASSKSAEIIRKKIESKP